MSFDAKISCHGSSGFWWSNALSRICILLQSQRKSFAFWVSCCILSLSGHVLGSLWCFTIWIQLYPPCAFIRLLNDSAFFWFSELILKLVKYITHNVYSSNPSLIVLLLVNNCIKYMSHTVTIQALIIIFQTVLC